MAKAKRQMADQLKLVDAVLEITDARIPLSSRNPDFENLFSNKIRLLILNKSDMADVDATAIWIDYFKRTGIAALPISANERKHKSRLIAFINESLRDRLEYYDNKRIRKDLLLMAVGIPNSGKSSIINMLGGGSSAKTGNKPGVTRGQQRIRISEHIALMDTPGVLWPKFEDDSVALKLALTGAIRDELLDYGELAMKLIRLAANHFPELLKDRYGLDYLEDDALLVLEAICQRRGFLIKGGEFDYERGAKTIINEFRNGLWGPVTLELPHE